MLFMLYLYDCSNDHRLTDEGYFIMVSFDGILTRLCNAFMMHMLSEPEIRQALQLWKFALNHVNVKSSMVDLYTRVCGDRLALPEDPALLTP